MLVTREGMGKFRLKLLVGASLYCVHCGANIVHDGKYPGRLLSCKDNQSLETIGLLCQICQLTLNKFAHRYVIEIFDFLPLNPFLDVLFLLCL